MEIKKTPEEVLVSLDTLCAGIQGKNELRVGVMMCNSAMIEAAEVIRLLLPTPRADDVPMTNDNAAIIAQVNAKSPRAGEDVVERAAEAVYDCFIYVAGRDNDVKPKWVPGGNSFRQGDARQYARAALEAASLRQPEVAGWRTDFDEAKKHQFDSILLYSESWGDSFGEIQLGRWGDGEWIFDSGMTIDDEEFAPEKWMPITELLNSARYPLSAAPSQQSVDGTVIPIVAGGTRYPESEGRGASAIERPVLTPDARNRALEEAATTALEQRCEPGTPWDAACVAIANRIRALKSAEGETK